MRLVALRYPVSSSVGNRARVYVPPGSDLLLLWEPVVTNGGLLTAVTEGGCSRRNRDVYRLRPPPLRCQRPSFAGAVRPRRQDAPSAVPEIL